MKANAKPLRTALVVAMLLALLAAGGASAYALRTIWLRPGHWPDGARDEGVRPQGQASHGDGRAVADRADVQLAITG